MKLNQYPLLWNIKEIYSFHWYNTSFQFQVKPFLAGHAEFVLCILLASPAFVLQAGRQAGGKSVPSFLWTTIHFEGINYAFSFHCAWVLVACQLRSVLLRAALPNTFLPLYSRTLLLEWLKSPALCKKFGLQPLFGTRKQSSRVVWQQVCLADQATHQVTDWLKDWLTHSVRSCLWLSSGRVLPGRFWGLAVINLICNEAFWSLYCLF